MPAARLGAVVWSWPGLAQGLCSKGIHHVGGRGSTVSACCRQTTGHGLSTPKASLGFLIQDPITHGQVHTLNTFSHNLHNVLLRQSMSVSM